MAKQDTFFDRIQRLFSTNVIVRNVGGKKLKVIDVNKVQHLPKLYYMQRLDGVSTNKKFFKRKFFEDYSILKNHYYFAFFIALIKRISKITQYF